MAKRDYLVDAAKQIRMALDREVNEDYEAAFSYYKNGVDLLLNGVQGTMLYLCFYCHIMTLGHQNRPIDTSQGFF